MGQFKEASGTAPPDGPFAVAGGCARALVARSPVNGPPVNGPPVNGRWVFVPGTAGFDEAGGAMPDDVAEQTRQTVRNIRRILRRADADLGDVVRVRVYLADAADFPQVAPILAEQFRDIQPASTTIECPLADPRMKIEIEVTARR